MSPRLARLSPHATRWGDFNCGDARITNKLAREALRAEAGLQALYGVLGDENDVLAAMTLRTGVLSAPNSVLYELGQGELEVPTVHIEALGVRLGAQGQGYGRNLVELARALSGQVGERVGVRVLSLEATPESRAFYVHMGFQSAQSAWPDGSWPMWLLLTR